MAETTVAKPEELRRDRRRWLVPFHSAVDAGVGLARFSAMTFGNQPIDGGNFTVTDQEFMAISVEGPNFTRFVRKYLGSREYINGIERRCLWIEVGEAAEAQNSITISSKIEGVAKFRSESTRPETAKLAGVPHLFAYRPHRDCPMTLIVPSLDSHGGVIA